jgi:hypothetical protein
MQLAKIIPARWARVNGLLRMVMFSLFEKKQGKKEMILVRHRLGQR